MRTIRGMAQELISTTFRDSAALLDSIANDAGFVEAIEQVANVCTTALKAGNKILFAGNGGSAADSQHLAAELVGRFGYDRPGLPAIALTADTSILTAVGNDYGFEKIFSRQIEALGNPGDVLFGFSTSGNSANVLAAFEAARQKGITRVALTGNRNGAICAQSEHLFAVPSAVTARIQEAHIVIGHTICDLIEQALFPAGRAP